MLIHESPDDDPTLSEQHGPLFVRRLHAAAYLIVGALAVTTIEDLRLSSEVFATLLLIKVILVAVLGLLLLALRVPALRQRPTAVGLLGVTATCVASAIAGIVRNDDTTTGLALMVVALSSAAVLPWGL
jgi:hypothetical protein